MNGDRIAVVPGNGNTNGLRHAFPNTKSRMMVQKPSCDNSVIHLVQAPFRPNLVSMRTVSLSSENIDRSSSSSSKILITSATNINANYSSSLKATVGGSAVSRRTSSNRIGRGGPIVGYQRGVVTNGQHRANNGQRNGTCCRTVVKPPINPRSPTRYAKQTVVNHAPTDHFQYELSEDLQATAAKCLERRYGGRLVSNRAARIIQRAYRNHQLRQQYANVRLEGRRLVEPVKRRSYDRDDAATELDLTPNTDSGIIEPAESLEDLVLGQAYVDWAAEAEAAASADHCGTSSSSDAGIGVSSKDRQKPSPSSASSISSADIGGGGGEASDYAEANYQAFTDRHSHQNVVGKSDTLPMCNCVPINIATSPNSSHYYANIVPTRRKLSFPALITNESYSNRHHSHTPPSLNQTCHLCVASHSPTIDRPPVESNNHHHRTLPVAAASTISPISLLSSGGTGTAHQSHNRLAADKYDLMMTPSPQGQKHHHTISSRILLPVEVARNGTTSLPVTQGRQQMLAIKHPVKNGAAYTTAWLVSPSSSQQIKPIVVDGRGRCSHCLSATAGQIKPRIALIDRSALNGSGSSSIGNNKSPSDTKSRVADNRRKRCYRIGLNIFNKSPIKGMEFLIHQRFLAGAPQGIAQFLLDRKGLSRSAIGEYLGDVRNDLAKATSREFLRLLDFRNMEVDEALKAMFTCFRTPAESQKIDQLITTFQSVYVEQNVDRVKGQFRKPDTVTVLAYAVVMLHTDMYSPNVRPQTRMTRDEFIRNLRGVDAGEDISRDLLNTIYDRMQEGEMSSLPDHTDQVRKIQQNLTGPLRPLNLTLPQRRLVCYCRLFEVPDKSRKDRPGSHQREVFLFNDLILITKAVQKKKRRDCTVTYQVRGSFNLLGAHVSTFESPHWPNGLELLLPLGSELISTNNNNGGGSHNYPVVERSLNTGFATRSCIQIGLNTKTSSDRSRFLADLMECILEVNEMDRLRIEEELVKKKTSKLSSIGQNQSATTTHHGAYRQSSEVPRHASYSTASSKPSYSGLLVVEPSPLLSSSPQQQIKLVNGDGMRQSHGQLIQGQHHLVYTSTVTPGSDPRRGRN